MVRRFVVDGTDAGQISPAQNAGLAWAAVFRAMTPIEQARRIAVIMAGHQRYWARRRGEPEPIIQTFDATYEDGKGVIQTSPLRDFDL